MNRRTFLGTMLMASLAACSTPAATTINTERGPLLIFFYTAG